MKVACIGGGPGGLFFATLLKRGRPDAEVTVFERNRPDDTFGFGVVFSDATLGGIDAADPVLSEALARHGRHWDKIEIRLRGEQERCGGNGMAAVVRKILLGLLQERARAAGVRLCFQQEIRDPAELAGFDLVVICDGANSRFREMFAADFSPSASVASAKFIWFGTAHLFDGLTFIHAHGPHGVFAAHAYPISDELSTFIVETDEQSWASAGLDEFDPAAPPGPSDEKTKAYLEDLFSSEIRGHALVGNNSRWANFATRRASAWRRDPAAGGPQWVLLGDAAHTAHFSVGSGTKMAMEDAVALARVLTDAPGDIAAALDKYETERRPSVERIQGAARPSLSWWEQFGRYARAFEPEQFGFHFLTRSITRGKLARRDSAYVAHVDSWWQRQHGAPPLRTPFLAAGIQLPSRRLEAGRNQLEAGGNREIAWINAPAEDAGLPSALEAVRSAARAGTPLVGVRGGTPLTRVLLAEEARLACRVPAAVAGPYDDDAAETLILSGRADLVVVTG
jgi:2-polyprenyl-6-methoxyphenol hydroxylase-like FAD-dependent oxidoreductase